MMKKRLPAVILLLLLCAAAGKLTGTEAEFNSLPVKAVLFPEPEFEAIYFVADNTGRHDFSKTYNEHIQKKNKYKKK